MLEHHHGQPICRKVASRRTSTWARFGKVRVKRDGVSLDMKRFEAVAMKQIETALGGSPHAQRAVLAAHERASKLRDAENAASCELWTNVLAANDRAAARAMAAGLSTAATSLSAIAKAITGAHWSGPRFFGIKAQVLKRAVCKALSADQRL